MGAPVEERTLRPEDLYAADEVFISSTNRSMLGVGEVNGHKLAVAPGPVDVETGEGLRRVRAAIFGSAFGGFGETLSGASRGAASSAPTVARAWEWSRASNGS